MGNEMNRAMFFRKIATLPPGELLDIQTAYWLSKSAHRMQDARDDGSRVFDHPRDVALSLIDRCHHDKDTVITALLHDALEDTYTPSQVYGCLFGQSVWESLARLSKYIPTFDPIDGTVMGRFKKDTAVYFGILAKAPFRDRIVKCADRRHNLLTMECWDKDRRRRYAEETATYLLPIAHDTDAWFASELERLTEQAMKTT